MPTLPAHYFLLDKTITDRAGDLQASYHLAEDGEAFAVAQPPQAVAAPLSGGAAAWAFNGQNSFACVARAPAFSGLGFWVCPETVDGVQVFLARGALHNGDRMDFSIGQRDGRLRITYGTDVWRAADHHFEAGAWTHVALLFTGDAPRIFINGEALASSQIIKPRNPSVDTGALASCDGALLLATEPAGDAMPTTATEAAAFGLRRFFDGSLDGLGLWTRDAAAGGLTAAAIRRLASGGPPDLDGLSDAPAEVTQPEPETPLPLNGHAVPDTEPDPEVTARTVAAMIEKTPEAASPELAETASGPAGPHDEIWNELKDLVTSINNNEPAEGAVPLLSDIIAGPPMAVPDLKAPNDTELCELSVAETSPGLLSTLAELEKGQKSGDTAEADPILLITAEKDVDAAEFQGPPDIMYRSNADLASVLAEECAKADDEDGETSGLELENGVDIKLQSETEADTAGMVVSRTEPAETSAEGASSVDGESANQRLREALTGPEETTSRRLFRPRGRRDASLPDLRGIRPHFGQKTGQVAPMEADGLPPIFSYTVSGAFADRVVDFGSPVQIKLVTDYGTTTPVPRKRKQREAVTPPPEMYDDLLDGQADELLFR